MNLNKMSTKSLEAIVRYLPQGSKFRKELIAEILLRGSEDTKKKVSADDTVSENNDLKKSKESKTPQLTKQKDAKQNPFLPQPA